MNILKESKEELPVSFLTNFVSRGWDEIGLLKAEIEGIKKDFKDTQKVEAILQDLIDAYLICIGQVESYLDKEDYIDYPVEETDSESSNETLHENIDKVDVKIDNINIDNLKIKSKDIAAKNDEADEQEECCDDSSCVAADITTNTTPKMSDEGEKFAYFCDFEEPDLNQPKLTDEDLY